MIVEVLTLFLLLGAKNYYTLGLFPMLFAAGAVWLEEHAQRWAQVAVFVVASLVLTAVSPFALPYLDVSSMAAYTEAFGRTTGVDAPMRWEDGRSRRLPQDYADMLGWEELAGIIDRADRSAPEPARTLIYCENYGQAGAATRFYGHSGLPEPVSFSDAYLLWAPRRLPPDLDALIYLNDEMGDDVRDLFADIRLIGTVQTPYARERGTHVYLCLRPRASLPDFWCERVLTESARR